MTEGRSQTQGGPSRPYDGMASRTYISIAKRHPRDEDCPPRHTSHVTSRRFAPASHLRQRVRLIQMLFSGVFQRLFVRVITGAHHRAAFDDTEADAEAKFLPTLELVGRDPT